MVALLALDEKFMLGAISRAAREGLLTEWRNAQCESCYLNKSYIIISPHPEPQRALHRREAQQEELPPPPPPPPPPSASPIAS